MKRLPPKFAIALFTLAVGVASASLYVVRHYRNAEEVSFLQPVSVPESSGHPEGWLKIAVGNKFSFYLPADMKQGELVGNIDYIGPTKTFGNETLEVNYGYVEKRNNEELWRGRVSCDLLSQGATLFPAYRTSQVEISHRRATQIFWQSDEPGSSYTTLCFPDVGDGTVLKFGARAKDNRGLDIAKQVFNSIEFP